MRIVNFISGRDLGGPKQSFVLYSEALSNLGHEVHSVVRKGASVKPMIESLNLPVHEINYSRVTQLLAASKVSKTLRAKLETIRPDLIFAHKQSDLELVRSALRDHVKIIGVVHWFSNKHIQHADELIAVSAKVKQFLVDNGYTKPIHIVPNMVKIISEPTYRDLPDVPLIGAMGLFRRKKGFHTLIEALAILKRNGTPFKAIIAGKGQLKPYLYYLRWRLNLKNELTFRGWVSNAERDDFIDAIDICGGHQMRRSRGYYYSQPNRLSGQQTRSSLTCSSIRGRNYPFRIVQYCCAQRSKTHHGTIHNGCR